MHNSIAWVCKGVRMKQEFGLSIWNKAGPNCSSINSMLLRFALGVYSPPLEFPHVADFGSRKTFWCQRSRPPPFGVKSSGGGAAKVGGADASNTGSSLHWHVHFCRKNAQAHCMPWWGIALLHRAFICLKHQTLIIYIYKQNNLRLRVTSCAYTASALCLAFLLLLPHGEYAVRHTAAGRISVVNCSKLTTGD